jgi:phosphoribosylformimino-5-aminoimidazole carboxamide ribotide isomerase
VITIPAIDLREGKVVRLLRGDPAAATVYDDDPVAVARRFEAAGARMIHVVDLDAALGSGDNRAIVADICGAVGTPVQTGGGLRSTEAVETVLSAGAARAVLGTSAAVNAKLLAEALHAFGDRVVVALDVRDREVMTHGWTESAGPLDGLLRGLVERGVARFLVTQISADGTMEGPDVELYAHACDISARPVIASGGVGGTDDLRALVPTGVEAAIVGKALYEGTVQLQEVVEL